MLQGRVSAAMPILSEASSGFVLDLEQPMAEGKTVRDVLREKHSDGRQVTHDALLEASEGPPPPHPVLFTRITGASIKQAALRTFGGAGPSGVDAAA